MTHDFRTCPCALCQATAAQMESRETIPISDKMEQLHEQQDRMMGQYGFYCHYVFGSPDEPNKVNIHTHGVLESFQHPDLQMVLPLPQKVALNIFHNIVDRIKEGEVFIPNSIVYGVIKTLPVKFMAAQEGDRDVLRIIFPDKQGIIEQEYMDHNYAQQYEGCSYDP